MRLSIASDPVRRSTSLVAILASILFLAVACNNGEPPPPTATPTPDRVEVSGTFMLVSDRVSSSCRGEGGYSDINAGTEVRLTSGAGEILDVTRLGSHSTPEFLSGTGCVFRFVLAVPPGYDFYTVEVGRRGSFTYTYAEITREGQLEYSIGR
jgi:hypothetical protein